MSKRKSTPPVPENQLSFFDSGNTTLFERLKHIDENGNEYWDARELMVALEYTEWRNFNIVIHTTVKHLNTLGHNPAYHIVDSNNMVEIGSGASRKVKSYKLSRFACYLIADNSDPAKVAVANAKAYFVIQTRRQELDQKQKLLKRQQDETGYQLKGKSADWAKARVEAKDSTRTLNKELFKVSETLDPNYGKIAGEQTFALFDKSKKEIVEHLGLLPKDADKYRDNLGRWANEAIRLANKEIVRQFQKLGRRLTDDEILVIIIDVSRKVAEHARALAELDGVDYLSSAELDEQGRAIIMRNVRLIE